jgi:type IV pilus assembly protein PilV
MKLPRFRRHPNGFTIIEVMVALVVISIGLLGVAKMQALAMASTSTSRLRSLAAIQAASLASAMHANRGYWSASILAGPINITGATTTTSDSGLTAALTAVTAAGADYCMPDAGAPCAPDTIAATDLREWAMGLNATLPNSSATINCPTTSTPMSCTILISWTESAVAVNKQAADVGAVGSFQNPAYTLYVEP